jgi:hypothetical protein
VPKAVKDVGEYVDHVQKMWEGHGCSAEPLLPSGLPFEYEVDDRGKETGKGHVLARINFPESDDAYLAIEDWLEPHPSHIRRQTYAYDLIYRGAQLESWHMHHGGYHRHVGRERHAIQRVTLEEAIMRSRELLSRGLLPGR